MLIPNSLGEQTLLLLTEDKATSPFDSELSLKDARAALKRESSNASGREGNVKFLEAWIRCAQVSNLSGSSKTPVPVSNPPVSSVASVSSVPGNLPVSNITPADKTSIRLANEPWEKDAFLESTNEEVQGARVVSEINQRGVSRVAPDSRAAPDQVVGEKQGNEKQGKKTVAQLIEEIKLRKEKGNI
jgi:hypothetical protein